MEEIYPPKIDQFANVTDGACTEEEIFSMEVTILKVSPAPEPFFHPF